MKGATNHPQKASKNIILRTIRNEPSVYALLQDSLADYPSRSGNLPGLDVLPRPTALTTFCARPTALTVCLGYMQGRRVG